MLTGSSHTDAVLKGVKMKSLYVLLFVLAGCQYIDGEEIKSDKTDFVKKYNAIDIKKDVADASVPPPVKENKIVNPLVEKRFFNKEENCKGCQCKWGLRLTPHCPDKHNFCESYDKLYWDNLLQIPCSFNLTENSVRCIPTCPIWAHTLSNDCLGYFKYSKNNGTQSICRIKGFELWSQKDYEKCLNIDCQSLCIEIPDTGIFVGVNDPGTSSF